jgi:hypothetical protein
MFSTRNKFRYFGFGVNLLILSRLETAPTSRGYEGGYRKRKLRDEPARRFALAGGPHRYYKYWLNGDWLNFMGIKGRNLPPVNLFYFTSTNPPCPAPNGLSIKITPGVKKMEI